MCDLLFVFSECFFLFLFFTDFIELYIFLGFPPFLSPSHSTLLCDPHAPNLLSIDQRQDGTAHDGHNQQRRTDGEMRTEPLDGQAPDGRPYHGVGEPQGRQEEQRTRPRHAQGRAAKQDAARARSQQRLPLREMPRDAPNADWVSSGSECR